MGARMSCFNFDDSASDRAKAHSDALQRQLDKENKKLKRECKILLLGSGESGKSTIVKQMKILHKGGFSPEERLHYRSIVYRNLIDSAQEVIAEIKKLGYEYKSSQNQLLAEKIYAYNLDPRQKGSSSERAVLYGPGPLPANENPYDPSSTVNRGLTFNHEIAEAIDVLWKDPVITRVMDEHSDEFYLMDSANYFFKEVMRIGEPDYLPNQDDVLRARQKTYGIIETRFMMGQLSIHMFDVGGQRSERKKWIHCFDSVTSIIFCTSLSEYDQTLLEEKKQNRLQESLILFESIINSRWFLRTSLILFLNKIDVFKVKIMKIPLKRHFHEYNGGRDVNKAAKYILWRFMQLNRAKLSVYPHLTEATDTNNIKLVFAALKETILQNALKDSGVL
ncbi:heterotrimeric G-protein alpha subunit, GPA3-like protein [Cyathus striatus]|nr:heterotrimeric G-protein alpha subunit, GPA3-like protein [Cyathus striatus]